MQSHKQDDGDRAGKRIASEAGRRYIMTPAGTSGAAVGSSGSGAASAGGAGFGGVSDGKLAAGAAGCLPWSVCCNCDIVRGVTDWCGNPRGCLFCVCLRSLR